MRTEKITTAFFKGLFGLVFVLVLLSHAPLYALTFDWGGVPIVGQSQGFLPSGSAEFMVSGNTLTLTLTNNTDQEMTAIGQVLTGLTWDYMDGASLTPDSALIPAGSQLVGANVLPATDLSGEWGYRSDISAGSGLGSYGVACMGSINFGADNFGPGDRFDTSTNLFGPESLDGIDGGIVGANVNFSLDGFTNQGPVVQGFGSTEPGQMVFAFDFTGTLNLDDITNVQPVYGSNGAPLVPEPATLFLLGSGLVGIGLFGRKRFRR